MQGFLPLCLVKSALFGKFLVSLPYLNRAGLAAEDLLIQSALVDKACDLADELDVKYLELRHGQPVEHPKLTVRRDEKKRMVLDLPDTPEVLWKGFDAKVRNQIRKGEKSGLTIRFGGVSLLDDFYNVFTVNMRDLGTPVYSKRLFKEIVNLRSVASQHEVAKSGVQQDGAELVVVNWEGKPVAGALLVHDLPLAHQPATTQVPSASSLRSAASTNANMWMYHQMLLRAMERGSQQFDFGRSSIDSGTYKFKKQWGATAHDTVWQYYVRKGDVGEVRPDNPKYQRRIAMWQRLPVWLTRVIGPTIV
ncbi:MAG: FemAB family PEP-CTERM system-associated protein, partial [Phycisphaerales bacterium]|nr:FemAB family PEP-CTERM system-associated protein [Phycisphaerales bacterium]